MAAFLLNLASLLLSFPLSLSLCLLHYLPLLPFSPSLKQIVSILFLYVCLLCCMLGRLAPRYSCQVKTQPPSVSVMQDKKLLAAEGITVSQTSTTSKVFLSSVHFDRFLSFLSLKEFLGTLNLLGF